MRRGLWFVAGTAAGVYATSKARRAAEALTLDGVHDRLTGLFAGARVLREEVRVGMAEKETELRARIDARPAALTAEDGASSTDRHDENVRPLARGRHLELTESATRRGDD